MIVANDNEADSPYEVRFKRTEAEHIPYWVVFRKGDRYPISIRFDTQELAERCRDVLIADDRRLADARRHQQV